MKLFVIDPANQRVYLNITAPTRRELATLIGGRRFYLSGHLYDISDVYAERQINNTITGLVVGGIVGAFGGPIGIIIGGFFGGLIGNTSDDNENSRIVRFNNSRL